MNAKGYFKWLLKEINISNTGYEDLFWHLYGRPFTWSIDRDENRAADGIALRRRYLNDGGALQESEFNSPCSVLEMLIALSIRCDREIMGEPDVDAGDRLFWAMIENLRLDVYDDSYFEDEAVDEILDIWLMRRFDQHGNGGPFPVKKVVRNQKKIEIWSQMNDFLNENYGVSW